MHYFLSNWKISSFVLIFIFIQWNLDLTKGQGTGKIYGGSFPYILLLLGPEKSFVIPTTSLYRGSLIEVLLYWKVNMLVVVLRWATESGQHLSWLSVTQNIHSPQVTKGAVPWRSIITSGPVWGIIVAAFASDWGLYVLLICVPLFLMDILHYEVAAVGRFAVLSS